MNRMIGAEMGEEMMPRDPAPSDVQTCRVCGCWFWDACWDDEVGACWWVEDDLCSRCSMAVWDRAPDDPARDVSGT